VENLEDNTRLNEQSLKNRIDNLNQLINFGQESGRSQIAL